MTIRVTSPGFADGATIPAKHTCEGADVSPALAWADVPPGTKSLALIVDDPDAPDPAAPRMTWVHWVLYNLPTHATGLPEAVAPRALPAGTRAGRNDFGSTVWGGPCPPIGRHRYFFKVYALDVVLPDLGAPKAADLVRAMAGHVIGQGVLVGTYRKGSGM
ncbi:MAG TPA: YbhB/YbcL family Raf kinase inhibitor-like protein [Myxococcota bacterium]|nr:YbhB/YbcL family Raf kinase inhibitor-like protein [Myxococcota bacterium]